MLETTHVLVGAAVLFGVLILLTLYLQIGNIVERRRDARKATLFAGVDPEGRGVEDVPHPKNAEEQKVGA